jgi:hypothetical protein
MFIIVYAMNLIRATAVKVIKLTELIDGFAMLVPVKRDRDYLPFAYRELPGKGHHVPHPKGKTENGRDSGYVLDIVAVLMYEGWHILLFKKTVGDREVRYVN